MCERKREEDEMNQKNQEFKIEKIKSKVELN